MKKNIFLGLALSVFMASCTQPAKNESIVGVYSMDKAVVSDGTTESVNLASEGNTQFKLYTPEAYFFIYQGKDASVGFGLGTYTFDAGKIVETSIFNTNTLDTAQVATLDIVQSEKGYTQSIPEFMMNGKKWSLKETYTSIAATGSSELDGVWHQVKNLEINGQDTVDRTYNEYKVFHAGQFMWAARYISDTANNQFEKIIGQGKFTLNKEALTEDLTFSSRKDILGKYNIIVTFNGTDEFTQKTADTSAKVVGFKTYKRISK